ncbi:hypothetical protein ABIB48_001408 [Arthrobacter sp. UYCu511]|uniref:LssY C-terminal domain-containing protein n=1 Tax=Arthrobacter sp. UYCu511 TaxID=3156337 RepID=UPI00339A4C9C
MRPGEHSAPVPAAPVAAPVPAAPEGSQHKVGSHDHLLQRSSFNSLVDNLVFAFSGIAALWLAWLVLSESLHVGWYLVPFFVLFWLILAYLVLPRVHKILTSIYVPDYFIGRARTSDGLLGDPINLAAEGSEAQLIAAMSGAGWIRADAVTLRSSWRIITSTVFKRSYHKAPVSPLLLFGRQQDLAYQQEVAGNPAKRHHVRFWKCPDGWLLPGGHKVEWLAAGTFDRAVGFSLFTLQITHKIDSDTDVERDHIVATLTESHPKVSVRIIEDFSTGYHSRNGGGDSIETDGNLPVVDVGKVTSAALAADQSAEARVAARERRRPLSIVLGVVLMSIRVVVGVLTLSLALGDRVSIIGEVAASLPGGNASLAALFVNIAMAVTAASILLYAALSALVFRGSNRARVTVMGLSVLLLAGAALGFFSGTSVTLRGDLFGLPVDILVLLALSAQNSSTFSRREASPAPSVE